MDSIESGYETEFSAAVIAIAEDNITLDRTLFYPLGGGQNWDVGTLYSDNGEWEVTEVRGRDDVQHFVGENHEISVGDQIQGRINWERRHAHMRMHTAQHLVSGIVYEMFHGVRTVGNQIHHDRSRIDFNPIKFNDEMLSEVVHSANEKIDEAHIVTDCIMTREEINRIMPPDRTNMDLLPPSVKELRVVRIGDNLDLCPCAGTHVRNLGEINHIKILGKKSKGKGTQRVSYTLIGI